MSVAIELLTKVNDRLDKVTQAKGGVDLLKAGTEKQRRLTDYEDKFFEATSTITDAYVDDLKEIRDGLIKIIAGASA